jgi:hypothetical protein
MKAFQLTEIKSFMNKLLLSSTFDTLLLVEATLALSCRVTIDGKTNREFFADEEKDSQPSVDYLPFSYMRPHCLDLVKGKKTPTSFKFIFTASRRQINSLISGHDVSIDPDDITGLILNIRFEQGKLLLTTAVSYRTFLPDKSMDEIWDHSVAQFLTKNEIAFEYL